DGFVEDADVTVDGEMAGGTTVPGDDNLPVVGSTGNYIPTFAGEDSFLTQLAKGENSVIAKYETQLGDRRFVTYGVTQGGETTNMPTTGTASYNGSVFGTVFGSQTG